MQESQKGPDPPPPALDLACQSALANLRGDFTLAEDLARRAIEAKAHGKGDEAQRNLLYALQKKKVRCEGGRSAATVTPF